MTRILLVGNPNVGKSALFSLLTGVKVVAANYPGTTVTFTRGVMRFPDIAAEVIDVPGIYSLDPSSKAEEVAVSMIGDADIIVNVVDSTNLERNLVLTCDLMRRFNKPMMLVLNMWDETHHKGVEVDVAALEGILGVPVVTTVGLSGEGVADLVRRIADARQPSMTPGPGSVWDDVGTVIERVQKLHHRHHTLMDLVEHLSIHPPFSFFVAGGVLAASFLIVRFIAEGLIAHVFEPLFETLYLPLVMRLSAALGESAFLHKILIGDLTNGTLDFAEAFGVLTTGVYAPIAMVFPYVLSFYFILGLLEDWGYLPRLAVITDRVFHRLGLHGYAIVPSILGLGCKVPGVLAIRLFEDRREKFIASVLLAIGVPCMAQSAMIILLLGRYGWQYVAGVFFTLLLVWLSLGLILNRFMSGQGTELLIEIPRYRVPHPGVVLKKLGMRMEGFLREAVPLVLFGVLIVNLLDYVQVTRLIGWLVAPVIRHVWGLPLETIDVLMLGFLRKDIAVGMLLPFDLNVRQAMVSTAVLSVYIPCVATLFVLFRELGWKDFVKAIGLMMVSAVVVGGVLNLLLRMLGL